MRSRAAIVMGAEESTAVLGTTELLERLSTTAVDLAWGPPLVILLVGGGFFLTLYSRLLPFRFLRHAVAILTGRYDKSTDPGQISHFRALSTALAATIGVGNIGGVAIAITQGGAGAVFWMWVAAIVGMATKFFTCTLAVLYRGYDSLGVLQGGPMYTIESGLGRRYRFLAVFFSVFGMVGCLPMFQTNQAAEILSSSYGVPPLWTGLVAVAIVSLVAFGGVERIAGVTSRLVPAMCLIYVGLGLAVMALHFGEIPVVFRQIVSEAWSPSAAIGGATGLAFKQVILTGVKRAAFSNEAGIGTAALAHGAARTAEPVREGLVAMLGPFIDTIVICSMTSFIVLSGGAWQQGDVQGVALTAESVSSVLGGGGRLILVCVVILFALSTMVSYSYYGKKCFAYLFGARRAEWYSVLYLIGLFLGAVWSAQTVVNIVDTAFAMMAFPNMLATLILAPRVVEATRDYFARLSA